MKPGIRGELGSGGSQEAADNEARSDEIVVQLKGITKRFPGVLANDAIDLEIREGEIHALLGENGAGKTTLMNILYGLLQADEGDIFIRGKKVRIRSPKDAIRSGIGMVHQHFMLVPSLTVTQNVILSSQSSRLLLNTKSVEKRIIELSDKYGMKVNPSAKIWQLSVGEQQRVEIIKALYRDVDVLILDEPTSVLTPSEVKELMILLRRMVNDRLAVMPFITHKLSEVMAICDRITVLRRGKVVASLDKLKTCESELAKLMVGKEVLFEYDKQEFIGRETVLQVEGINVMNDMGLSALNHVSFSVREGEIVGVAGVSGNGQRELAEVIVGLRKAKGGRILVGGQETTSLSPREIINHGVAYIPEDRMEAGLIMDFSVAENLMLEAHAEPPYAYSWFLPSGKNIFINRQEVDALADRLIKEYSIAVTDRNALTRTLSGGNLQKLILARKLLKLPKLLIACQPTKGLDVAASEYVRQKIVDQAKAGVAVLLISEDLDEIMSISDSLIVMHGGRIAGQLMTKGAKIEDIGLMMAGSPGAS